MALLDMLLSVAALACLLIAASAALAVAVVLKYIRDHDKLGRTLRKTERTLGKVRDQMAAKQKRILQLQQEIAVLRPQEERLSSYYDTLVELQTEAERAAMTEEANAKVKDDDEVEQERRRRLLHLGTG